MKTGILYGLGVGPGDPELMTVKAWRIISMAPVVAYLTANGNRKHGPRHRQALPAR